MSATLRHLYLLYHELRTAPSTYSYVVEQSEFARHVDLFKRVHAEDPSMLRPEITFDDGHISNLRLALPVLAERGVAAHFFITVGWTGTRSGYMGWNDLRELHAAGQQIGAHGWSHTLLTHCDAPALQQELDAARLTLEDKLGTAITSMSLPGGRFDDRVLRAIRSAGYRQIFTSIPRSEADPSSSDTLGRLNIRNHQTAAWLQQLLSPSSGVLHKIELGDRWKSRLKRALGDRAYARLWATLNRHEPDADAAETIG